MKTLPGSLLLLAALALLATPAAAGTIIDNDLAPGTLGYFSVDLDAGSQVNHPNSSRLTGKKQDDTLITSNFLYEYIGYVDVGNDGHAADLGSTASGAGSLTGDDEFTSSGSFLGSGQNTINWTAVSSIADGADRMITAFTFTAEQGSLGDLRFIRYLDEDLLDEVKNVLFTTGSSAAGDLQLFTLDEDEAIGVSQAGSFLSSQGLSNADFVGWGADVYDEMQWDMVVNGGTSFTPTGSIGTELQGVGSYNHSLLGTVWGPEDITSGLAWDVDPTAATATIYTTLGGVPELRENPVNAVPLPGAAWMGLAFLGTLGVLRRIRRKRDLESF